MVISDLLHGLAFAQQVVNFVEEKLGSDSQETGAIEGGDVFYGEAASKMRAKAEARCPPRL
mgnify:CR=1 FL=1